jgi:translation initiation factor IF-2
LMPGSEERIGRIVNYFSKVSVAAIQIEKGTLSKGDQIRIKGATTDFIQEIKSMEIDRNPVDSVSKGQSVGIKVENRVRPNDVVYRL